MTQKYVVRLLKWLGVRFDTLPSQKTKLPVGHAVLFVDVDVRFRPGVCRGKFLLFRHQSLWNTSGIPLVASGGIALSLVSVVGDVTERKNKTKHRMTCVILWGKFA